MVFWLYRLAIHCALPFALMRLWIKSWRQPAYRLRWKEHLGIVPAIPHDTPTLWLHAVSVGETISALPLLRALRTQYPQYQLVVTTTTLTGSQTLGRAKIPGVYHCYFPYDTTRITKRFLNHIHPKLLILIETEIWPVLFHTCYQQKIPILLANARLSSHSFSRFQYCPKTSKNIMRTISRILAQSPQDQSRFLALGAEKNTVSVAGNLKFDLQLPPDLIKQANRLDQPFRHRLKWLAASTHPGEELSVLQAFKSIRQQCPDALLILAPRHPERTHEVIKLCQQQGWHSACHSHSHPPQPVDILIIDVLGVLLYYYQLCDVAFVGGSLISHIGGHNPLEPAALAKPIISGTNMTNCSTINTLLLQNQAIVNVADATQLAHSVIDLLQDPEKRSAMGQRAQHILNNNTGVVRTHMEAIAQLLDLSSENAALFSSQDKHARANPP